jgi:prepilin-type N-terminal cleavage/methylation domain-containing protein
MLKSFAGPARRRTGFTLIELLVVIAIIAILAAILFPVFAQAKEAAKKTQSISNTKQMSLALNMYANDYDDAFPTWSEYWAVSTNNGAGRPLAGVPAGSDTRDRYWDAKLSPYVKNGNPAGGKYNGVWRSPSSQRDENSRSYGVSYYFTFAYNNLDPWSYRWLTAGEVVDVAGTIWGGDSGHGGMLSQQVNYDGYYDRWIAKQHYRREAPWRYSEGAAYMFYDGHSKWVKGDRLFPHPVPPATNYSAYNGQSYCAAATYFAPKQGEIDYCVLRAAAFGVVCTPGK